MSNLKQYDSNKITWFIAVGEGLDKINRGGTHSIRMYADHANSLGLGKSVSVQYVTSRDKNKNDVGKWFTLDESRRRFQVRQGEQDIQGITQYAFLKNSPDCEGSPNGTYVEVEGNRIQQGVMFRELDSAKDAEVALDAEARRTEAIYSVLKLDEGTLSEIAAFIGVFRDNKLAEADPDKQMRLRVFEWAGKRPNDYFTLLNAGDRGLRAIVRKAIADGTFTQKGTVIYWESTMVGGDEDAAIATLIREPQMLEVLQKKVDLKTTVKAPEGPPKNKGGRPIVDKKKKEEDKKEDKTQVTPEQPQL